MEDKNEGLKFVVCIKNGSYAASLEVLKIYKKLPDKKAEEHNLIRIIDESGEDYLYPVDYFAPIEVPQVALDILTQAA